jgi:catechol 2,3-dioxygenase-like lactoylglutathione lyase family enzyme
MAAPCFIVRDLPETLAFYRDKLGFEVTFEGPEPKDIFFGIVERGSAMIMFKSVGVEPVPNHKHDIGYGVMKWDAYVYVPDPDALAAEYSSRDVSFLVPPGVNSDKLRGFEIQDVNGFVLFFGRPV